MGLVPLHSFPVYHGPFGGYQGQALRAPAGALTAPGAVMDPRRSAWRLPGTYNRFGGIHHERNPD